MSRICLYYRVPPGGDRWVLGDRFVRPSIRRLVRGRPRASGVDKVFANLCLGLDRLGIPYFVNLPFQALKPDDRVGILGRGRYALEGYEGGGPIVAGIGLMTHPSEWPSLCDDYPIAYYLQHSEWANAVYRPFFKDKCRAWPVGIDTDRWCPSDRAVQRFDFLIYDKIQWQRDERVPRLLEPIREALRRRNLTFTELRYGRYDEPQYRDALSASRAMIFLCEHESQGLACQECLASGVPILAWDQGRYLDPNFTALEQPHVPATSVPYFDDRCGLTFRDISEFPDALARFLELRYGNAFCPRAYINENLTLEKCAARFVQILDEARQSSTYCGDQHALLLSGER
jgi:glycosyltransferase involved in cell wall biosynthesis